MNITKLHKFKVTICMLAAFCLCMGIMSGCSLADKDIINGNDSRNVEKDCFVGVLITKDDLIDMQIANEKIYAKKEKVIDENDNSYYKYEFDIPESIGMYTWVDKDKDGEGVMYSYDSEDINYLANEMTGFRYDQNDGSKITTKSGTIYINKDYLKQKKEMTLYIYKVYQESSGEVYIDFNPVCLDYDSNTMTKNSRSIKEAVENINDGNLVSYEMEVKLTVDFIDYTDQTELVFFDGNGKVSKEEVFDNERLPERISISKADTKVLLKYIKDKKPCGKKLITFDESESVYQAEIPIKEKDNAFVGMKTVEFVRE